MNLVHLIDKLDDTFSRQTFILPQSITKKINSLKDLFCGKVSSTISCLDCGYTSTTFQDFSQIHLNVERGKQSLESAIQKYLSPEKMMNSYKCKNCIKKISKLAIKQIKIHYLPKIFVFVLLYRYEGDKKIAEKDGNITFLP